MRDNTRSKGFSLIELMIVIAIIGVLAAVAIPTYKNYVIKSKVSKMVEHATVFKTTMEEHIDTVGPLTSPCELNSISAPANNSIVFVSLHGDGCYIEVASSQEQIGLDDSYGGYISFMLKPTKVDNGFIWRCMLWSPARLPDASIVPQGCMPGTFGDPNWLDLYYN